MSSFAVPAWARGLSLMDQGGGGAPDGFTSQSSVDDETAGEDTAAGAAHQEQPAEDQRAAEELAAKDQALQKASAPAGGASASHCSVACR